MGSIFLREPVDGRQYFLDLIADDVAAYFECHAVDPFAVRLVGHADGGHAGPGVGAVDQDRDQNLAAVFRETACELRGWGHAWRESGQHFWRPVGVGECDYTG